MAKKIVLIVFGCIAAAGLVIAIIGFALGGWFGSFMVYQGRLVYEERGVQHPLGDVPFWIGDDGVITDWGTDASGGWESWSYEDTGGSGERMTMEAPFDNVSELKAVALDVSVGYVDVRVGDSYSLEVQGPLKMESSFVDGVWTITSKIDLESVRTSSENWKSGPRFYRGGEDITTQYVLTLPKEVAELSAGLEMGVMDLDGLVMGRAALTQNLGLMRVAHCEADDLNVDVDLGAAEIKGFETDNCTLKVGLGNIDYEGSVAEILDANCDLGNISCKLEKPERYGYTVDVSLGNITIGEQSFSGSRQDSKDSDLHPLYRLTCGLGNIDVTFTNAR